MGRHVDAAGTPTTLRRTAQICGLLGGAAWVVAYFLDADSAPATALLWAGAVLLTVALFGLGLLLVKSDVLALRVFVALALPTLVWGVFGLVRDSVTDDELVDAVFGALVGLLSGPARSRRRDGPRATL